jgi:hypothetical protein
MNSCIMTNKAAAYLACEKTKCTGGACAIKKQPYTSTVDKHQLTIQCFTPKNATGPVSLVSTFTATSKKISTDQNLVTIPANAIIDRIEFFGINGFATKGNFSIGLGQLNTTIMTPLVENTTSIIANEKVGGCREFSSTSVDGRNAKTLVLLQSYVNVVLENPVTAGNLHVVIDYHMKPVPV